MNKAKIQNYLPLPLRILQDKSLQAHRICYCNCECEFPLLTPNDRLPPMIIRKSLGSITVLSSARVYTEDDVFVVALNVNLFHEWTPGGTNPLTEDIKYFIYYGNTALPDLLPCGNHYLELTFSTGGGTLITAHVTELFNVKDKCCLSRIEWGNATDEDMIPYDSMNFKGILYLDTQVSVSYKDVTVSKQNEIGEVYIDSSRIEEWIEVSICQGYCYLVQSLLTINYKTYKRFFKADTGESADIIQLQINVEPNDENECLCHFDLFMRQDSVATLAACDDSIPKTFYGHDYLTPLFNPLCDTCISVSNITAVNVTYIPNNDGLIDVTISWDAVEFATQYQLVYDNTTVTSPTNSIVLTLTECRDYTICILAQCGFANSDVACIQITTPNRICPTVVDFVCDTHHDQTSIELEWVATLYDVIIEWVEFGLEWSSAITATVAAGGATGYMITGLDDCTSYVVRVKQDCSIFECPENGEWVQCQATTECCEIAVVIDNGDDLDCNTLTTEITISATDLFGIAYAGNYHIFITLLGSVSVISSATNEPLVHTLGAGNYTVTYQDTDYGCSYSQSFNITIDCDCDVPANISIHRIMDNSAQVVWDAVPSATSYEIEYKNVNDTAWTSITGILANAFNIVGLNPCNTYEVRVRAICGDIVGSWSSLIIFDTGGCETGGNTCVNLPSLSFECSDTDTQTTITATDTGVYSSVGVSTIEFSMNGDFWVTNIGNAITVNCGANFYARIKFTSDYCPTVYAFYYFTDVRSCSCYNVINLSTGVSDNILTSCDPCCVNDINIDVYCECDLKRCFTVSPDSDTSVYDFIIANGDYTIVINDFTANGVAVPGATFPETLVITDEGDINYEHIGCGFDLYPINLLQFIADVGNTLQGFDVLYWDACGDNYYGMPFRLQMCKDQHVIINYSIYSGGELQYVVVFDSEIGTTINETLSSVGVNCIEADSITNKFEVINNADITMSFSAGSINSCLLSLRFDSVPLQAGETYSCEMSIGTNPLAMPPLTPAVFTVGHMVKYTIPTDLPTGMNYWIARIIYTPNGAVAPITITRYITFNNIGTCNNGLITIV